MKKSIISAIGILLISFAASANASIIGFYNITGNNFGDAAIGEAQLFVDVTVELFVKHRSTQWVRLNRYEIEQQLITE